MPSRSPSQDKSDRVFALNAAAAAFSPKPQAAVFEPVQPLDAMTISFETENGTPSFVPHNYTKDGDGEGMIDLENYAGTFSIPNYMLARGETDPMSEIQKEVRELHSAHRMEVEKLRQELDSLRSSIKNNNNGNGDETGKGERGGENQTSDSQENDNGSKEAVVEEPDIEAVVGKKIIGFLRLTKDVPYPHRLYGKTNYSTWRESILYIAERTECSHIIENEERVSPHTDENSFLWDQKNDWLHNLIWDSISAQAMESVARPKKHSAYILWNHLEVTFRLPLEEERRAIFHSLYPSQSSSDREYIKQFQEARRKLEKLGFPVLDWLLYDILYGGVSDIARNIIHQNNALKQEETPNSVPQTLDFNTVIDELVACLPPEDNTILPISTVGSPNTTSPSTPSASGPSTANGSAGASSSDNTGSDSVNNHRNNGKSASKKNPEIHAQPSFIAINADNETKVTSVENPKEEQTQQKPSIKCEFCARRGHTPSGCYMKHPELATERCVARTMQAETAPSRLRDTEPKPKSDSGQGPSEGEQQYQQFKAWNNQSQPCENQYKPKYPGDCEEVL
ncbi:hypothetical protein AJ79_00382 [Helicocarpus griseus UAMH5409]|uniref:Uncharacterized protein n=1 Tax=Helicocarpus griseus UAMH5409 TaxID=1447875 RepID=A0A2B7YC46_9EURO|nr:hypothetical protein AJ79_00382 [Helicocarpus griseus UAMH5409]